MDFKVPEEIKAVHVDCEKPFTELSEKSKKYAEAFFKASYSGLKIIARQISIESPGLLDLIKKMFTKYDFNNLTKCKKFSEYEKTQFLNYWGFVCGNGGNYKSHGDSKFIPNLSKKTMSEIMKECFPKYFKSYKKLEYKIFSLNPSEKLMGYPETNTSMYLMHNYTYDVLTKDEIQIVNEFMASQGVEGWNTRLLKHRYSNGRIVFAILVASSKNNPQLANKMYKYKGLDISYIFEDHFPELERVVKHLKDALKYSSNEHQTNMIKNYIKHFESGDINLHKESQRHWIKDVGPEVETNIGFIENYRDPDGVRAEFEGFVAVVNKEQSKKYSLLVENADKFLPLLPWDNVFEKDKFSKPDYTSLDVLGFCTSGCPIGINIPNYDDIRVSEGFKNVSLSNIMSLRNSNPDEDPEFIPKHFAQTYKDNSDRSLTIGVACHELIGHGSGKLFMEDKDKNLNVDRTFLEKNNYGYYKYGETWGTKFGRLASSYEECRAESIALYYACCREVVKIFGIDESSFLDNLKTQWLAMMVGAIRGSVTYNQEEKTWLQAHSQARFVIYKVLKEAGLVNFKIINKNGKENLEVDMKLDEILTTGKEALGKFLNKLQIYKATADVKNGCEMYTKYSTVDEEDLKIFNIYNKIKKPRSLIIFPTINNGEYVKYEPTVIGKIQATVDKLNLN